MNVLEHAGKHGGDRTQERAQGSAHDQSAGPTQEHERENPQGHEQRRAHEDAQALAQEDSRVVVHRGAPFPLNENVRLRELQQLHVLDSLSESAFDHVVGIATGVCGTPIGLISLVDSERQWFKAARGVDLLETHRNNAFCAHAILRPRELLIVEDATIDERFASNPLVLGEPHIRFYAGAPIVTASGVALGTVCVIDTVRRKIDKQKQDVLRALARQTANMLRLRAMTLKEEMPPGRRKTRAQILKGSGETAVLPKIRNAWSQAQFWRHD